MTLIFRVKVTGQGQILTVKVLDQGLLYPFVCQVIGPIQVYYILLCVKVLDQGLRKNSWAKLVIMTLQLTHVRRVLNDILPQLGASEQFLFLG